MFSGAHGDFDAVVLAGPDGKLGDYEPQTEEGREDLQRIQRATRGRLGYPNENIP
ncbi:MAG: hypothetical protein ACYTAS_23465 [Planctomycetota bacterium]|jgi:hypothetical protein